MVRTQQTTDSAGEPAESALARVFSTARYFVFSLFIGAFSPVVFVLAPLLPMLPPVPMPVPAPVVPGVARSGIAFVLPASAPAPGSVGDGVVGLTLGPD
jgi:hypothetical protein